MSVALGIAQTIIRLSSSKLKKSGGRQKKKKLMLSLRRTLTECMTDPRFDGVYVVC